MERCNAIGLPVTLAMTVNQHNLPHLWDTIEWASGSTTAAESPSSPCSSPAANQWESGFATRSHLPQPGRGNSTTTFHLNTADIILGAVNQSSDRLQFADFTPLPCGDPNCATIGYPLKTPLGVRSVSEFIDFAEVQGFLKDKVKYRLEDLIECGCDNTALGDILKQFELRERDTSGSSSSPSWTPGTGTRTALTAAAPTSSAPTANSTPSAATTPDSPTANPPNGKGSTSPKQPVLFVSDASGQPSPRTPPLHARYPAPHRLQRSLRSLRRLAVAYFQAKITLTFSGLLFIFFTACAGAFDSHHHSQLPEKSHPARHQSIWANTAVFTLIMSFTAPVIIVTVFFAACMFTASNTY